jgi:hypothetical protein
MGLKTTNKHAATESVDTTTEIRQMCLFKITAQFLHLEGKYNLRDPDVDGKITIIP